MEVVSVEVLVRRRRGEEEIEEFENEQLEGSFALSVQEEDDIFTESFVSGPLSGEGLHDFVYQRRAQGVGLIRARVVSRAHVLFVQYELDRSTKRSLLSPARPTYHDSYNGIVVRIVHIVR